MTISLLKVTSARKLFFVIKQCLMCNLFFYLKKKECYVLKILRFLCFCETCRFQNLWRHHKHCCIMQVTLMLLSFESQVLFGQILVCCMTNISNMFLAKCWRLETSSRLFYDFIKMIIQQDLAILVVEMYHF